MPNKRVWVWIGLDLISKLREFKVPRSNMIKLPSHLLPAIRPARSETLGGSPRGQWFWSASWDAFASWTIGKAPRQPPKKKRHFVCTQYIQLYTDYSHQLAKSRHQDPTFLGGQSVLMAARLSSTDMLKSSSGALKAWSAWNSFGGGISIVSLLISPCWLTTPIRPVRQRVWTKHWLKDKTGKLLVNAIHTLSAHTPDETFASKSSYPAAHSAVCAGPSLESLRIIRSAAEVTTW